MNKDRNTQRRRRRKYKESLINSNLIIIIVSFRFFANIQVSFFFSNFFVGFCFVAGEDREIIQDLEREKTEGKQKESPNKSLLTQHVYLD